MTRAECIAELRQRRDACQRTAEIHPCELARARSWGRVAAYESTERSVQRRDPWLALSLLLGGDWPPLTGHVAGQREAYRNALELVGQIAGEP